uniref:Uncharacterized protein n=1 Tax=Lepeophtheirus salmonis TaxID=72036 RepID=A0A0K2T2Y8_LEPSM
MGVRIVPNIAFCVFETALCRDLLYFIKRSMYCTIIYKEYSTKYIYTQSNE